MVDYITSNPAIPGLQAAQNTEIQIAQLKRQQEQVAQQDATQRRLASFYATPTTGDPKTPLSPAQQALTYATQTPGAGEMALQLATAQGKAQEDHEDKAMKLLLDGDAESALSYAQTHKVDSVVSLLAHPTLVREVISFGSLADKIRPKDVAYRAKFVQAGMESLPQVMATTNPATGKPYTYQEALPVVQAKAMKAAESVPISQGAAKMIQDAEGNWYAATSTSAAPLGVKGAKPTPKGSGGRTPAGNSLQRTFSGADGYLYGTLRQPGPNGEIITKQLVDEKGQPIRSSETSKFAGQVYLKTSDQPGGGSIPDAQATADQLYPPKASVVTRRYVPGKGFVSVP
jgi:hypothetical protein